MSLACQVTLNDYANQPLLRNAQQVPKGACLAAVGVERVVGLLCIKF